MLASERVTLRLRPTMDPVVAHVIERLTKEPTKPREPKPVTIRKFSWES